MNPGLIALLVIFAIVALGSAMSFLARAGYRMDLEQWTVGGRGFGLLLVFLLMAGETYTTFAFLGASGWVYSRGAPALYILAYLPLAQIMLFHVSPVIWRVGRKYGLKTQADYFEHRYGGRLLPAFVAIVGIAAIIPYLQLQLTALGIIVNIASFGAIGRAVAILISGVLVTAFVLASGIRGAASMSILKDVLMVVVLVALGVAVPWIKFGGVGAMFSRLIAEQPARLTMPGATTNLGHAWYVTTVLLCSLGILWPHSFAAIFTGKSGDTLRRNAIAIPLYNLSLGFIFLAGFAAVLAAPKVDNGDLALLTVVRGMFPPWFLGVVGGAGALTALVPASVLVLAAATLFAKNIYRPLFAPGMTEDQVGRLARATVVAMIAVSLFFALASSVSLVSLLLLGYGCVAQLMPGIVLGLYWPRTSRAATIVGSVTGVAIMVFLGLTGRDPFHGCNAGFLGLCVNLALTVVVTWLRPAPTAHRATVTGSAAALGR